MKKRLNLNLGLETQYYFQTPEILPNFYLLKGQVHALSHRHFDDDCKIADEVDNEVGFEKNDVNADDENDDVQKNCDDDDDKNDVKKNEKDEIEMNVDENEVTR